MSSAYLMLIPQLALLLVHLAGLVVAILLLVRAKSTAAILAAVAFGLLTLLSLGQIIQMLPPVSAQIYSAGPWLPVSLSCCCSLFDAAAIVCLIVAIWQAVSGTGAKETEESFDETWEEEADQATDVPAESPDTYATEKLKVLEGEVIEEAPRVTRVLSEEQTLEGEIMEDTPYATKALRETEEESEES
jgi:hypothetical protein